MLHHLQTKMHFELLLSVLFPAPEVGKRIIHFCLKIELPLFSLLGSREGLPNDQYIVFCKVKNEELKQLTFLERLIYIKNDFVVYNNTTSYGMQRLPLNMAPFVNTKDQLLLVIWLCYCLM